VELLFKEHKNRRILAGSDSMSPSESSCPKYLICISQTYVFNGLGYSQELFHLGKPVTQSELCKARIIILVNLVKNSISSVLPLGLIVIRGLVG